MKKNIRLFLVIISLFVFVLSGCTGDKYDKLVVKDVSGNYYMLKHSCLDTYFIEKIDKKTLDAF